MSLAAIAPETCQQQRWWGYAGGWASMVQDLELSAALGPVVETLGTLATPTTWADRPPAESLRLLPPGHARVPWAWSGFLASPFFASASEA